MNQQPKEGSLKDFLIAARGGELEEGWLFLAELPPRLTTRCVLLVEEDDVDLPKMALERGYPHEGLDSQTIDAVVGAAEDFESPATEELMLESFAWYLEQGAFLPEPGAQRALDKEFYASLGAEDPSQPCKAAGCGRGQLSASLYCKVHHFEMLRGRPCPFSD